MPSAGTFRRFGKPAAGSISKEDCFEKYENYNQVITNYHHNEYIKLNYDSNYDLNRLNCYHITVSPN